MTSKVMLSIVTMVGSLVAGEMAPAWAGGPADNPTCLVKKHGGSVALKGTVAVGAQSLDQANTDVDFTLRLERGGSLAFFRASVNMQVYGVSNEGILCTLLNDDTSVAATTLRAAILQAFGLSKATRFVLTDSSISKAEIQGSVNQWMCNGTYTNPTPLAEPTCGTAARGASMADVVIYAQ
jgi:hypothetical protein